MGFYYALTFQTLPLSLYQFSRLICRFASLTLQGGVFSIEVLDFTNHPLK